MNHAYEIFAEETVTERRNQYQSSRISDEHKFVISAVKQTAAAFMETTSSAPTAAQVLVVGGGFAGISAAQTLQESKDLVQVTLISPMDVFEFGPLMLRSLAEPYLYGTGINPYESHGFRFIHGTVLELSTHEAKLMSHSTNEYAYVRFDYCIWSCGALYTEPCTTLYVHSVSDRLQMLSRAREQIEAAKR